MKIDNFKKVAKFQFFFPILLLNSIAVFVVAMAEGGRFENILYGLSAVLLITYILLLIKKPYYFYFEPKQKTFLVRYFHTHVLFNKKRAFEVPIDSFEKYIIEEKLNGYNKYITFFIKTRKSTGSYPTISISSVPKDQIESLKKELDTIIKIKNLK